MHRKAHAAGEDRRRWVLLAQWNERPAVNRESPQRAHRGGVRSDPRAESRGADSSVTLARYAFTAAALSDQQSALEER